MLMLFCNQEPCAQLHIFVVRNCAYVPPVGCKSGHLIFSCGTDCKIKLLEMYNQRGVLGTYLGHRQPVRDFCFNNDCTQFLSAGYDRYIKLWVTERREWITHVIN